MNEHSFFFFFYDSDIVYIVEQSNSKTTMFTVWLEMNRANGGKIKLTHAQFPKYLVWNESFFKKGQRGLTAQKLAAYTSYFQAVIRSITYICYLIFQLGHVAMLIFKRWMVFCNLHLEKPVMS